VNALVVIFQSSLDFGNVPADWKTANVTPLQKTESRKIGRLDKHLSLGEMLEYIIWEVAAGHLENRIISRVNMDL